MAGPAAAVGKGMKRGPLMGFDELAGELHKNADAEGKKIIHAAQRNAAKIVETAQEKAEETVKGARKDMAAAIKQETAERITSAKLTAKKIVDEARDDAVEAALHDAWREFKTNSLKKATYPALLSRLIEEGVKELGSGEATIYVRDEDRPLVQGYRLAKLPSEYSGGVIVESANGKIRVNKTVEEIFSQKKSSLRKEIYDKLF
jgi:vacuolar-type H+-ATPase subunit E/Vma4